MIDLRPKQHRKRKRVYAGGVHRPPLFYRRAAWQRVRAAVLARSPLCADPFGLHRRSGQVVLATDVDHVVPRHIRPDLAYDRANLQALCKSCHSMKTRADGKVDKRRDLGTMDKGRGGSDF